MAGPYDKATTAPLTGFSPTGIGVNSAAGRLAAINRLPSNWNRTVEALYVGAGRVRKASGSGRMNRIT